MTDAGEVIYDDVAELLEAIEEHEQTIATQKRVIEKLKAALEHYESAHYTISGFPCDHDGVARETICEIEKGEA